MARTSVPAVNTVRNAGHTAHQVASSPWVTALARCGYAAKGVVYIIIGWLAVQAAFGAGGRITDTKGAILTIYNQPFGAFLLGVVTVGLFGFALWSFMQALMDTEAKGSHAAGIAARSGYAAVGVSYAILAYTSLQLVLGAGHGGKSSDATTRDWTARLLAYPAGRVLVALVGLIILGTAAYLFYKAYSARFRKRLNLATLSATAQQGVITLGRCGYAALGVVFSVVGIFMVVAALRHNPSAAKGLGGALEELARQPFGPALPGRGGGGPRRLWYLFLRGSAL